MCTFHLLAVTFSPISYVYCFHMYLIFRMEETVALPSDHVVIAVFTVSVLTHHEPFGVSGS